MNWDVVIAWTAIVSAGAAVVAAGAAVIALWWQSRLTRFSANLDMLSRLDTDSWNSEQMRDIRRKVASNFLSSQIDPDIEEILDFFDSIGLLLRRHALDKEMVWAYFSYWALRYWCLSEDYIKNKETLEQAYWQDYKYLVDKLVAFAKRHRPKAQTTINESKLQQFLNEESTLS